MFNKKDLKIFDIFAPTYQQKVLNDSSKRSTIIGGLFSIIIIVICLGYASYLLYNYVNGKYQPKQNDYTSQTAELKSLNLLLTYLSIFVYNDKQTLIQLETQNKIKYFTIRLSVITNSKVIKQYFDESCYDSNLEKTIGLNQGFYYCFNQEDQNDYVALEESEYANTIITIDFMYCQQNYIKLGYRCATVDETNAYLYDQDNNFQISIETDIYNLHKDQYVHTNFTQDLYSRQGEILNNTIFLQLTNMQVIKGVIFQSSDSSTYFYNMVNQNNFFPQNTNPNQLMNPISTVIRLDRPQKYETIQFIPITQVLSEAWTTISLLLVLGNIARIISETGFVRDLLQIQLKFYYKKTARRLCPQEENKYNSKDTTGDQASNIFEVNEQVEKTNYKKNIQNYFNISKWQKFSMFYLPSVCQKRKHKTEEQVTLENLIKQTNYEMNIYEMHKELLKMKLIIKMLVSPEQYAAIQMCGCDLLQNTSDEQNFEKSEQTVSKSEQSFTEKIQENKKIELTTHNDLVPQLQDSSNKIQINNQLIQNNVLQNEKEKNRNQLQKLQQINIQMQTLQNIKVEEKMVVSTQKKQIHNHLEILNKIDIEPDFKKEQLKKFLQLDQNEEQANQLNKRIRSCMMGIKEPQDNSEKSVFKLKYNIEKVQPKLSIFH
ncbi:transmembrane protein, putative (macronuclear) [Tetrahymena thermophila SB210]|uniref:Transmembrane protein, putative n=1 Tax=Tetrahymena thermophila (strain SB210) TaxID=312017 RepID=I7LXG1_TETTS|nr:transmembrane protein, putative [Tetrahymena thermophila SB210]EAS04576.2 transmembrane protein, putative [Tetrahymena thermophila SB210]|eukprot:XP_001024821.2 transmembrane protein, putative [Tetrahymena thermophila SB210]